MSQQALSWQDVDALVEHLLPQFYGIFDALVMVVRGGLIPGAMIAERLNIIDLFTASVSFGESKIPLSETLSTRIPLELPPHPRVEMGNMPHFSHFPPDALLDGRRTLVVNHVWNHGRSINAVAGRVLAAGGSPELCVLHFKPANSIFPSIPSCRYSAARQ